MLSALRFVNAVADQATFTPWTTESDPTASSGRQSIIAGEARVGGRRLAIIASDFAVAGGSIGAREAAIVSAVVERATREQMPILASPASGGIRMQEGTRALLALVDIVSALQAHQESGLLYLVYLRNPTTGGALVSWGASGNITWAEPDSLIGFLGPKVVREITGQELPRAAQSAETLYTAGRIDGVFAADELRSRLAAVVAAPLIRPQQTASASGHIVGKLPDIVTAMQRTTDARRPGALDVIEHADQSHLIMGDILGPISVHLSVFSGNTCVVIAERPNSALDASHLQRARRAMSLAERLRVPLVTIVDTLGGALTASAERAGLAWEIAASLGSMIQLNTPTISVLLGRGTGAAAFALLPADRVVAASNAWLAPLPLEGARPILGGDSTASEELPSFLAAGVASLLHERAIDEVIAENPDAADEPRAFASRVAAAVARQLGGLATSRGRVDSRVDALPHVQTNRWKAAREVRVRS